MFDGGGIRIEGVNTSLVNVSNTRISNNRGNEGGAISQRNGTLTIMDCIIDGNSTTFTSIAVNQICKTENLYYDEDRNSITLFHETNSYSIKYKIIYRNLSGLPPQQS